jgi:hypothetical protein
MRRDQTFDLTAALVRPLAPRSKRATRAQRPGKNSMKQRSNASIGHQAVGACGEKAVEAELLRRGWITSNVNASIRNAADFDIFALKNNRSAQIRVKACGEGENAFHFRFARGQQIACNVNKSDFTVLVQMGATRNDDHFYCNSDAGGPLCARFLSRGISEAQQAKRRCRTRYRSLGFTFIW